MYRFIRDPTSKPRALERMLGPATALLIGVGIAIGSGIFRVPGIVAQELGSPVWILLAWLVGGGFCFASGLVSAELATRFPRAGGEYVYLREAYGEFLAFFFGWAFTIFIVGGGAATIAAAAGEAAATLFGLDPTRAPILAALAVVGVTAVNAIGLRSGAAFQNLLTAAKLLALVAIAAVGLTLGRAEVAWLAPHSSPRPLFWAFIAALPPVLFSYGGTTDTAKLAEEVRDPQRALPRALLGAAAAVTAVYVLVNVAYLFVLSPAEMAGRPFVANDVFEAILGPRGRVLITAVSLLIFIGGLSSTLLATVRVTFALARDGLTFGFMARMSRAQSPVFALLVVGGVATTFTLFRGFSQILDIYFLASALLFGLTYFSLIVFRRRDHKAGRPFPDGVFRCPGGPAIAIGLIAIQLAIAVSIVRSSPEDSAYTVLLLGALAGLYWLWKLAARR